MTAILLSVVCMGWPMVVGAAPPSAVEPPTGVLATALSTSSIRVTWLDVNSSEDGYEIERSLFSGTGFSVVDTTGANGTASTDAGLAAGTRYYYRLRAFKLGKGNKPTEYSAYSQTVSAQTFSVATTTSTTSPTATTSTTSTTIVGGNQPPVALAGSDKSLAVGQLGGFDARQSYDPDGSIVAYLWNFGDGGNWGNSSIELRSYANPGTYTVTLYVQDNSGTWSSDTVLVFVGGTATTTSTSTSTTSTTIGSGNLLPVANAGPDKTLTVGQLGTFDGRASFDPDGFIVSYLWNFGDGGVWGSSALTTRSYSSPGTYPVTLYVQDNSGVWTADTAIVTVGSSGTTTSTSTSTSTSTTSTSPTNQPPVASGGPDKQATEGQLITFDGRGSFDPDGSIVAYLWLWNDGSPSANSALATHAYSVAGTYTPQLWVQDNAGAWSQDTVVATISGQSGGAWLGRETGSSNQQSTAVAKTGTSDVVVGGFSNGTVQIGGTTLSGVTGRIDGYVAKYASSGALSWASQLAPTTSSTMVIVEGVAGDASGNAYAIGRFTGSMRAGSITLTSVGAQDAFVVKYGSTGTVQWARRYGGTADDVGNGIGVDSQGSVFVTGYYTGAVDFGGGVLEETKILPAPTLFVVKLTSNGSHTWSRSFAGTANEVGLGLAVAPSGDVIVGGTFSDRLDLGGGQYRTFGVTDGFVASYSSNGLYRWSRQVGGTNIDEVLAVATDANGNVAITGKFRGSANFGGSALSATPTVSDMFVASYTSTGGYRWARSGGAAFDEDAGSGVGCDGGGNVFVVGSFIGSATFGTSSVVSAGGRDIFLVGYGSTGGYLGVDTWGGAGNDEGLDVVAWGSGQVATSGFFRDTSVVAGQVVTSTGGSDGVTARTNQ